MDISCQKEIEGKSTLKQEVRSAADYVEFRDGMSEDSPLMGKWCGNGSDIPSNLQATKNHLLIR